MVAAIPPVHAAFAQGRPAARLASIFDDSLPSALSEAGALTPAIAGRIGALARRMAEARAEGAIEALKAGDAAAPDRLVAGAVPRLARRDAIVLAHFSTSRAPGAARAAMPGKLVLAAPGAAVAALRRRFPGR